MLASTFLPFACAMFLALCHDVVAQNLLRNAGFEDGTNEWFLVNSGMLTTTNSAYSGAASGWATLTVTSSVSSRVVQSVLGRIETNQSYTLSGYFKAPVTYQNNFTLTMVWGDGYHTVGVGKTRTLNSEWTLLSGQFDVTGLTGPVRRAEVWLNNPKGNSSIELQFDDLVLSNSSPMLSVAESNEFVRVQWPRTATGYVLEAKSLLPAAAWTPVTADLQTNASSISYLGSAISNAFYRLRKP
jgi:hypothetical protein